MYYRFNTWTEAKKFLLDNEGSKLIRWPFGSKKEVNEYSIFTANELK